MSKKTSSSGRLGVGTAGTIITSFRSVSALQAILIQFISGIGLASGFLVARNIYSTNLVTDPSSTLRLIWMVECPILILLYSWFRSDPQQCTYLKAVGRAAMALPLGALVNALGAVVLGAPVGIQYLSKSINWSLLMSSLTFVPIAAVFGTSWTHWKRIFACSKPNTLLENIVCMPVHGAVIGAWFGAWPMPLDWERPWQEWPICVTYGAISGYVVAIIASIVYVFACGRWQHLKDE